MKPSPPPVFDSLSFPPKRFAPTILINSRRPSRKSATGGRTHTLLKTLSGEIHMKIVVFGGSGLIGARLVKNLHDLNHDVISASPRTGINAMTGEGLPQALAGAHAVVDVMNSPSWEDAAVLNFFETSTRN